MTKRVTLLTSLLALSGIAHAADAVDFKWNAEMRGRFHSDSNVAASTAANPYSLQQTYWEHRNKLGLTATKGEGLAGHVTLINNMDWGRANGIGQPSSASPNDMFFVSEAYGWWKATENIGVRVGRMGIDIGDGSIISLNDWQRTPFTFDGAGLVFDYDFARIGLIGVDAAEVGTTVYNNGTVSTGVTPTAGNRDPEVDFYGISVDAKQAPEWLKMVNVHYIIETQGEITAGLPVGTANTTRATVGAANIGRYGITVGGNAMAFDYGATYAGVNGTIKNQGLADLSEQGWMYQANVGFKVPEWLGFRIGLAYHADSGNDSTTGNNLKTYQPFYYDRQKFGGQMQIVGWGNLTYYQADVSVSPSDATGAGVKYTVFNRTNTTDAAYGVNNSANAFGGGYTAGNVLGTGIANTGDKAIGNELDVYVNHAFDGGFSVEARYGTLSPGAYLTANGANVATPYQYYAEGKFVF